MRFQLTLLTSQLLVASAFVVPHHHHDHTQKNHAARSVVTYRRSEETSATTAFLRFDARLFSTASEPSEAERLMQRARELRESAVQDEHQVHVALCEKKVREDAKTDQLIHNLFFEKDSSTTLVDRLHKSNLSIGTLERIVDRLDEREVIAEGKEHVRLVQKDGKSSFERVSIQDDEELARVQGKIEELIQGVAVLDEEFRRKKNTTGDAYVTTHTDDQHWGSDKRADRLTNRAHEIRRGREEQFQKRLEEFYEAQRIKKDKPAPPKAKDEHRFLP